MICYLNFGISVDLGSPKTHKKRSVSGNPILDTLSPKIAYWISIIPVWNIKYIVKNKLFYEKHFAPILIKRDLSGNTYDRYWESKKQVCLVYIFIVLYYNESIRVILDFISSVLQNREHMNMIKCFNKNQNLGNIFLQIPL